MARRIKGGDLQQVILETLREYNESVGEVTKEAVKAATKVGVKAVKAAAKDNFNGSGKYAKSWTSQVETGRLSAQGVIYNAKLPGLPHLLEHGHAKRNGGRVSGRIHIAPVETALEKAVQQELENRL